MTDEERKEIYLALKRKVEDCGKRSQYVHIGKILAQQILEALK